MRRKMTDLFIRFSKTSELPEADYAMKLNVRSAIRATLAHLDFEAPAEVSVTFCDNAYIREINKAHRGVDKHTDVLSFPMWEAEELEELSWDEPVTLGDIVISLERAKEQAGEIGNSFHREVAFLAIHSTLHLLGYDHERSPEDDELQCSLQREIIETIDITAEE